MSERRLHAVTGAFGYTGKYIARRLLAEGHAVITLTNSPDRQNEFGGRVPAFPFHFDRPHELARNLGNVQVLYNTYWVRFNHRGFTHAEAVRHTRILFEAAKRAGVERIVHVSITNPALDSPLEYFRGKAELEEALAETGVSHAILRPAVVFGKEDVLINNIAWALRRLPLFGVFGDGAYRLQPIYVEDLAQMAFRAGATRQNVVLQAIGPQTFTYRGLVATIAQIIGIRPRIVSVPPRLGYWVGKLVGLLMRDVVITWEEIEGLMAELLYVDAPSGGTVYLTDWIAEHAATLGRRYTSELARRLDRKHQYASN